MLNGKAAGRHDAGEEKRLILTSPITALYLSTLTPSLFVCRRLPSCCVRLLLHALGLICFCSFTHSKMASQQLTPAYDKYRYEALFGVWLLVTGATFMRIKRQPYSTRLKVEQYESIFKGTSLGAIVLGVGMSPKRGMKRVA
jgi:hypothetical protein